ncbi:hypothetical protein E4U41_006168 [Claviceps citrina]|nr:hypothetical protein E4U41_006168 [Claviceps citrina]
MDLGHSREIRGVGWWLQEPLRIRASSSSCLHWRHCTVGSALRRCLFLLNLNEDLFWKTKDPGATSSHYSDQFQYHITAPDTSSAIKLPCVGVLSNRPWTVVTVHSPAPLTCNHHISGILQRPRLGHSFISASWLLRANMFATQQCLEPVDSGRKRFRDDEGLALAAGFGEHRNKRFQSSLPLRNAHRAHQLSLSHTIVPLNASPAEAGPRHTVDISDSHTIKNPAYGADVEMDTMVTAQSTHSGPDQFADVSGAQHDPLSGRIPTPIQPSFAVQVRGPNASWATVQAATVPNGSVNLGHHATGFSQDKYVPRAMNGDAEWHVLQNHRRLPSPISEGVDSAMNGPACALSGMTLDHESCPGAQSQLSAHFQCAPPMQPSPTHGMEHPNAMMGAEIYLSPAQYSDPDADHASRSPGRKGHQRSKHTVNSWTWQPGMKKSFSIGFRSDCEKCRLKVPGHFNHIVIS